MYSHLPYGGGYSSETFKENELRSFCFLLEFIFVYYNLNLTLSQEIFTNNLLLNKYYKIVTIHLCLANTDVTEHQATGKGGRKYVFQIH